MIAPLSNKASTDAVARGVGESIPIGSGQSGGAETLFFDPGGHNEALALLSADALRHRRLESAFMFADRRCRRLTPGARDFLLRATASRLMGYEACAKDDLERAFEIDPTDELVASSILVWGPKPLQGLAAANTIAGASEDPENSRARDAGPASGGRSDRVENAGSCRHARRLGRLACKQRSRAADPSRRGRVLFCARSRRHASAGRPRLVSGCNRD